jgi:hypothetical protein
MPIFCYASASRGPINSSTEQSVQQIVRPTVHINRGDLTAVDESYRPGTLFTMNFQSSQAITPIQPTEQRSIIVPPGIREIMGQVEKRLTELSEPIEIAMIQHRAITGGHLVLFCVRQLYNVWQKSITEYGQISLYHGMRGLPQNIMMLGPEKCRVFLDKDYLRNPLSSAHPLPSVNTEHNSRMLNAFMALRGIRSHIVRFQRCQDAFDKYLSIYNLVANYPDRQFNTKDWVKFYHHQTIKIGYLDINISHIVQSVQQQIRDNIPTDLSSSHTSQYSELEMLVAAALVEIKGNVRSQINMKVQKRNHQFREKIREHHKISGPKIRTQKMGSTRRPRRNEFDQLARDTKKIAKRDPNQRDLLKIAVREASEFIDRRNT